MRVLGGHSERRLVIVMHLVDVFVEAFVVGESVHPVVPCVLDDGAEEHTDCNVIPEEHRNRNVIAGDTQTVMSYLRSTRNSDVIPGNTQTVMSYVGNTQTVMSYLGNTHELQCHTCGTHNSDVIPGGTQNSDVIPRDKHEYRSHLARIRPTKGNNASVQTNRKANIF